MSANCHHIFPYLRLSNKLPSRISSPPPISGEGSHLSGGSEDRAPAAMARAITVHVDTMKVGNSITWKCFVSMMIIEDIKNFINIIIFLTHGLCFLGDVLRLRPESGEVCRREINFAKSEASALVYLKTRGLWKVEWGFPEATRRSRGRLGADVPNPNLPPFFATTKWKWNLLWIQRNVLVLVCVLFLFLTIRRHNTIEGPAVASPLEAYQT